MAFVYVLWVLGAVALLGMLADVSALKRGVARKVALVAVGLKAAVAFGFLAWWVALRLRLFEGWGDLTTLATLIVVSVPLLVVAFVCDVLAVRALLRAR